VHQALANFVNKAAGALEWRADQEAVAANFFIAPAVLSASSSGVPTKSSSLSERAEAS
jgi:hypothetical protein